MARFTASILCGLLSFAVPASAATTIAFEREAPLAVAEAVAGAKAAVPVLSSKIRAAAIVERLSKNVVTPPGISRKTREAGVSTIAAMLRDVPLARLERLDACAPSLLFVPQGKLPTEFAPFSELHESWQRGVRDFWPSSAGIMRTLYGNSPPTPIVAVAEWVCPDQWSAACRGTIVHEMGHAFQECGLNGEESLYPGRLYREHKDGDGLFPTEYASTEQGEYFADSVAAWFGVKETIPDGNHWLITGSIWIQVHDPKMYSFLYEVLGPPKSLDR